MTVPGTPLEIERKFLLDRAPEIPAEATTTRLEQGYLPPPRPEVAADADMPEGRLRRVVFADGSVTYLHTVKRGVGLVREERERTISRELFERHWPRTVEARLCKTRHELRVGEVLWVVDVLDELDVVLAEAELPSIGTPADPPPWLAGRILRDVTDDPRYTNAALARRVSDGA